MSAAARLQVHVDGPFSRDELLRSPSLDGEKPAVKIAVDQVRRHEGKLCFRVLIVYGLPNDYLSSFGDIESALVLVVRDSHGRAGAVNLVDPTVMPLVERSLGFVDRRSPEPSPIFASGRVNVQVEVACDGGEAFVHVALHGILSNVVCVSEEQK